MNEEVGHVECRKLRSDWWVMLVLVLFVAGALVATILFPDGKADKEVRTIGSLCFAASLLGLVYTTLATFRTYIIADENGLSWRDIRTKRFARWDEVTDFYEDESSTRKVVIETKQGDIDVRNFNNQEAFRAWVQSHATNAASREWTTRHVSKKTEWPQTFAYKRAENVILPLLPFVLALLILPPHLAGNSKPNHSNSFFDMTRELSAYGGPLLAFAFVAMMTIIAASLLFPFSMLILDFICDTRPRWRQRIVAMPDDITFSDGEKTIRATWKDVTKVTRQNEKFLLRRYVVETRQGNFDFSNNIYASSCLLQLFREYSNDAIKALTQKEAAESVGGLGETFVRDGQRIHHFRARHNRIVLWSTWFFALIPILLLQIYIPADAPREHRIAPVVVSVLSALVACWFTLFTKTNYVATDERGLTQRTSFRAKFIAWNDVERFGKNDWSCFVVIGANQRICFWSEIAEQEQLLETIAQSSTRSQTREWHHI